MASLPHFPEAHRPLIWDFLATNAHLSALQYVSNKRNTTGLCIRPAHRTCIYPPAGSAACPTQFKGNQLSTAQSVWFPEHGFLPKNCRHQTIPDKQPISCDGASRGQKESCPATLSHMAAKPLHQSVHSLTNNG